MPLTIKNADVERLVEEVTRLTGESKTQAVRRALEERRTHLAYHAASEDRGTRFRRFLEQELWPVIPSEELGHPMTRSEEEALLGYGPEGV